MRLKDYLKAELVFTGLEAAGPEEVVDALADRLAAADAVADRDEVARALLNRERAHSTAMGQGFALPHATIVGMTAPILAVAVAPRGVPFGATEDDEPVRVFFTLLSPPGREGEHIKLLARICRLVRHPGFVDEVAEAADEEAVVETVRRVDEEHV